MGAEEEEEEEEKEGGEKEEEEEEEGEEGEVRRRQAQEGPAQGQGQDRSRQEIAAAAKKKGTGIFKPVTLSKDLSAICGMTKATRGAVTKALWAYIKKKGLSKGRTVSKIPGIFAGGSMFKLPGAVSKHLK